MNQTTAPKKFCFILMPFTSDFEDIYKLGIKQSCIDAGAYCERVDEQIFSESILERIYNQISKADIVIADMTGRNANVFYEVGYAHALGKTTILLTRDASDIPFDLKHYPHIIYNNKITTLKDELTNRLKWHIENEETMAVDYTIGLDLYVDSQNLLAGEVKYKTPQSDWPVFTVTIHNNTFKTFLPTDYRIGVITDSNYFELFNEDSKTAILPDGFLLHMLAQSQDILYPNSYTTFTIRLKSESSFYSNQIVTIRLFTAVGTKDFPLNITY